MLKNIGFARFYYAKKVCLSIQTETSSESSEESLDQMAENIQKYLGQKDADDVKKIVSEINSAKDSEQSVDGYVRLNS